MQKTREGLTTSISICRSICTQACILQLRWILLALRLIHTDIIRLLLLQEHRAPRQAHQALHLFLLLRREVFRRLPRHPHLDQGPKARQLQRPKARPGLHRGAHLHHALCRLPRAHPVLLLRPLPNRHPRQNHRLHLHRLRHPLRDRA